MVGGHDPIIDGLGLECALDRDYTSYRMHAKYCCVMCLFTCTLITALYAQPASVTAVPADEPQLQPKTEAARDSGPDERFHWKPALLQSGLMLVIQHAGRMVQPKTRRELGGPFWSDYFESASNIHTWNDSDSILTDYFGHPWMGAITGRIQVQNDPRGRVLQFDLSSKQYWHSRLKAMAWTAAYSTQYELGPVSEASIGNVGKKSPTMAAVDLVMTPIGGTVWLMLEDYLDTRFVARWERGSSMGRTRFLRVAMNPGRSIANLLRWKRPSFRDDRTP